MKNYDLIVVGAGALGTFHSYFALKKGLKVLLVEKDNAPNEATVRNFGQIIPSGMDLNRWHQYGREAMDIYKALQQEADISVRNNGSTYLASSALELQVLQEMQAIHEGNGYTSQLLTQAQCQKRFPNIQRDYCVGGLLFPQEITVEPRQMIHRLIEHLTHTYNLDYRPLTTIKDCDIRNNQCVLQDTRGEHYMAPKAIVCSGRDVKLLFPDVFSKSGMRLSKLHMMATEPLPEVQMPGSVLTGLSIRHYESFQSCPSFAELQNTPYHNEALKKYGIHILFKQATDGSIIIGDSHEYVPVDQAETLDFGLNMYINELILTEAQRIMHLPNWKISRYWAGFYSKHPDEVFEYNIEDKIFITTGIGGKGMTTSAGYAKHHVEEILG
ncbi:MAG TPA: TIGR03364 family FAD-dependent oxidoreductase [Microscillaceae bacterium]|nr:TIGR03364 family FAD-dependent oxidoreductase [Microscillaceae bacterium]